VGLGPKREREREPWGGPETQATRGGAYTVTV